MGPREGVGGGGRNHRPGGAAPGADAPTVGEGLHLVQMLEPPGGWARGLVIVTETPTVNRYGRRSSDGVDSTVTVDKMPAGSGEAI